MEQMTRKVLITGGLGLIGKELIYKLSKKKIKLTIIELESTIKKIKTLLIIFKIQIFLLLDVASLILKN